MSYYEKLQKYFAVIKFSPLKKKISCLSPMEEGRMTNLMVNDITAQIWALGNVDVLRKGQLG